MIAWTDDKYPCTTSDAFTTDSRYTVYSGDESSFNSSHGIIAAIGDSYIRGPRSMDALIFDNMLRAVEFAYRIKSMHPVVLPAPIILEAQLHSRPVLPIRRTGFAKSGYLPTRIRKRLRDR